MKLPFLPFARQIASSGCLAGTLPSLLCSFFVGGGVVSGPAWAQTASSGGTNTFVEGISANPANLFPITSSDGVASTVSSLLFESLAFRHWDTYEWTPKIATKWEISPDGKEFTFFLDKRARFANGNPVTAEDVKFSYDAIFLPGVESAAQKPYYEKIKKVEILAPDKIKFSVADLYYKNFDVVADLTIFEKKHYMKLYAKDKSLSKAESTKSPMGSSQWSIDRWDENQQVVLKRNPNYWDKDRLIKEGRWNYDRHIFKIIPEDSVEFEAFRKGDISFMGLSAKQWTLQTDSPEFKTRIAKVKTVNKAAVGYGFVGWNQKHPILGNKDVRWALSHLMNLNMWSNKIEFGMTEPTIGPFSPKSDQNDPTLSAVPFDLKAARKRLAAAGWKKPDSDGTLIKDGKRFEITIIYPTQSKETVEPMMADFKNQSAKVGVVVNLKAVEWTSFTKLLDDRNFDGCFLFWTRDIDGDVKQIWHSASIAEKGSNFISYANPEVDKLIDEHRSTLDVSKRNEHARKLQRLIYEDQPYSFLTERKYTLYAHQNTLKKQKDTYNYSIGRTFWKFNPQ